MYLIVELINEKEPLLIKLSNQPYKTTSMDFPFVKITRGAEFTHFNLRTGRAQNIDIGWLKNEILFTDNYGETSCHLKIQTKEIKTITMQMLDDDSLFIKTCRIYYSKKYGFIYNSK